MTKKKLFNYSFDLQQPQPVQSLEQLFNTAMRLHQGGNLQQAEQLYRQILDRQPKFAYAINMLGVLLSQKKEHIKGAKLLQKAIKLEPNVAEYHINLGFNLQEQGKLEEAEKEFAKATRLAPDSSDAWFNLGNVSLMLKKTGAAVDAFVNTIEKNKSHLPAYNNLGNIYRELRMFDEALKMFNKVIELNPDLSRGWYNLGKVYRQMGDGENAVKCFEKVIAYEPANLKARCQIADYRGRLLNDIDRALKDYDSVIESNPDYTPAYRQKADMLAIFGRYEEAGIWYRKGLEIDQTNTTAYLGLIYNKLYNEQDIKYLLDLLGSDSLETRQVVDIHFALGSVFDERKEYETAFRHFEQGNRLHRSTFEFPTGIIEDHISRLISVFDKSLMSQHANSGVESRLPVFIIGMPRSGTTLVEQIIASHPKVYGAGELQHVGNLVQSPLTLEDRLASTHTLFVPVLTEADINNFANDYLAYINKADSGIERITDKMPQNFLFLGYIALMFPQARIIHCNRNPMDTCLSIYTQKFTQHHPYAYDLAELGAYYKQYQRLMSHWESLLGDRILTLQYEDLLSDPEGKSRELIDHVGLDWNDRCLHFHESNRPVQTACHLQVRQKIYTTSRERWRNYAAWLGPLRSALGDEN